MGQIRLSEVCGAGTAVIFPRAASDISIEIAASKTALTAIPLTHRLHMPYTVRLRGSKNSPARLLMSSQVSRGERLPSGDCLAIAPAISVLWRAPQPTADLFQFFIVH
jgi:hypothetical protein